jgi:hypothetical protein
MLSYSEKEEKTTPFHAQGLFPKPLGKGGVPVKTLLPLIPLSGYIWKGK